MIDRISKRKQKRQNKGTSRNTLVLKDLVLHANVLYMHKCIHNKLNVNSSKRKIMLPVSNDDEDSGDDADGDNEGRFVPVSDDDGDNNDGCRR